MNLEEMRKTELTPEVAALKEWLFSDQVKAKFAEEHTDLLDVVELASLYGLTDFLGFTNEWLNFVEAGYGAGKPPVTDEELAAAKAVVEVYAELEGTFVEIGVEVSREIYQSLEGMKQRGGDDLDLGPIKNSLRKIVDFYERNYLQLYPTLGIFQAPCMRGYFAGTSKSMMIAVIEGKNFTKKL